MHWRIIPVSVQSQGRHGAAKCAPHPGPYEEPAAGRLAASTTSLRSLSLFWLAAQLNCLERLGVHDATLRTMMTWATQHPSVTPDLPLQPHRKQGGYAAASVVQQREVTVCSAVRKNFWDLSSTWDLMAFAGSGYAESISLGRRVGQREIKTTSDTRTRQSPNKTCPRRLTST
jgi:hypothetical protein